MKRLGYAALGVAAMGAMALAQTGHGDHGQHPPGHMTGQAPERGHGMRHGLQGGQGSAAAYAAEWDAMMARMHTDMTIPLSGDADVDFIRGMIPHHQGAIDMAELVLAHGADPEVAALARAIIAAQEAEIAMMRDWLAARGQ